MSVGLWNLLITTGGVAQDILPARLGRSQLIITPLDEALWINFGETAAIDNGEVVASGERRMLEPMGAADRKIVHDAAQNVEGVTTLSEGEEPHRRVVIAPANAD